MYPVCYIQILVGCKVHCLKWNMLQTGCRFKQITALFTCLMPPAVSCITWDTASDSQHELPQKYSFVPLPPQPQDNLYFLSAAEVTQG